MKELEERGLIRRSNSAWASPLVLIKKKDGKERMCVDYRLLNNRTLKDAYPLPRVSDILDCLSGAKYFSTLDLKAGYWQVPMESTSCSKTAFPTPVGLFEFRVMPFGLTNASGTFQSLMSDILNPYLFRGIIVYLNDIIVFAPSEEKMFEWLKMYLNRCKKKI